MARTMTNRSARPSSISAYLSKRAVCAPWRIDTQPRCLFKGAVVVPSLAESQHLPLMLASLAANPPTHLECFLILIVVNNREQASPAEKYDNQNTITLLPEWKGRPGLINLHWVDAASAGHELPAKDGVGLARRIGMDLALPWLDYGGCDPLLICLDADTTVQPNYLEAISSHFDESRAGGASINYRHRPVCDPAAQAAIDRYELFLRAYVLGLELAGSPYAFHTVGSAMACRASAYVASGGMNRRQAGEDFYFLQQIHKVAGVDRLTGTTVHPSPRASQRVPFGTGRAVGDMLKGGAAELMFYQPRLFDLLGMWLKTVRENQQDDGDALLSKAGAIALEMADYLRQAGFEKAWDSMRRQNRDSARLQQAFHGWFDAFRTMRLMHYLTDNGWPRVAPEQAVPPLLEQRGRSGFSGVAGMLEQLRLMQG